MDKWSDRPEAVDSRQLWEAIFTEDSPGFLDYYDQWKMRDNQLETRYRDGRLVSMVHWNPYTICAKQSLWKSYYIVAVSTRPEYRHQGLMAEQLRDGMRRFRKDKIPFLFLMPADPAIYHPFDFRYIYDRHMISLEGLSESEQPDTRTLDPVSKDGEDSGAVALRIRPLQAEEWALAATFANAQLRRHFQMYACRSRELMERTEWECRSEGGALEGIFEGEELVGLLDWWGDESIEIREVILSEAWEAVPEAVTDVIRQHFPKAKKITMVTTGAAGERQPIIMGRIVHLEEFLKIFDAEEAQRVRIRIEDPILEENHGCFLWSAGPKGSELIREEGRGDVDLELSIADLMSWLSGYKCPDELASVRMNAEGREFVQNIRPLQGIFLPEIV